MTITLPIRIVSESNQREHWAAKARRVKKQRQAVAWMLCALPNEVPHLPVTVTFTRVAPRKLDKGDNLNGAFKACRDEVAWFFTRDGIKVLNAKRHIADDEDSRLTWRYAQERGAPKTYAARIEITHTESNP
jgi:hypothetical protein